MHGKPFASKGVVILGGDPMPKQAKYPKSFIRKEKALPVYNHCKYHILKKKVSIISWCLVKGQGKEATFYSF